MAKLTRGALQITGGAIPLAGGVLSALAGFWSEGEQDRVNRFVEHWVRMLRDEMQEKEKTILEIMARLDLQDEEIAARVESKEYQSLLKKTFREWAGAESETKREYIRNILANAASSRVSSDDVVRLYRETDLHGNFLPKAPDRRPKGSGPKPFISAFDDGKGYELTELGKQFVHYAMTDIPPKIEFTDEE